MSREKIIFLTVFLITAMMATVSFAEDRTVWLNWNEEGAGDKNWPGWTWKDATHETYGGRGWCKNDGINLWGECWPRTFAMNSYGSDSFALVDISDRAPSTIEGGCLKIYDETKHRAGWYLWKGNNPFGKVGLTNANTDRLSFYLRLEGTYTIKNPGTYEAIPNATIHIGTFLCWDGSGLEGPGNQHYYHLLTVNPGTWVHVLIDQHPTHRRDTYQTPENVSNDPRWADCGRHYFENFTADYIQLANEPEQPLMVIKIDELEFYSVKETEEPNQNDESIASLYVGYWPDEDWWEIGWSDLSVYNNFNNDSNSVFDVRWSNIPITNNNFNSANKIEPMYYAVDKFLVRRASGWTKAAWTRFRLPDEVEKDKNYIYFAVKDVSVKGAHKEAWPYNKGDFHDAPSAYIHTIDYVIRKTNAGVISSDINNDGEINVLDVQLCVNVVLGREAREEIVNKARQVTAPLDVCDVLDIQTIVNIILTE